MQIKRIKRRMLPKEIKKKYEKQNRKKGKGKRVIDRKKKKTGKTKKTTSKMERENVYMREERKAGRRRIYW